MPELVGKLPHHQSEVWRVSWNVSGTILASTGDDGVSRLWKQQVNGTWTTCMVATATPMQQIDGYGQAFHARHRGRGDGDGLHACAHVVCATLWLSVRWSRASQR